MRSVVTDGHRHGAGRRPRRAAGKSGTAEYGSGDPPPTHAWFIAFRGDLAIAVLVEGGRSGGAVAAPIAKAFFDALGPQRRDARVVRSALGCGARAPDSHHRGEELSRRPALTSGLRWPLS